MHLATSCGKRWTEAEHIKRWWSPRPYQTPECEIELRPGGKFYTRMTGPGRVRLQRDGLHPRGRAGRADHLVERR